MATEEENFTLQELIVCIYWMHATYSLFWKFGDDTFKNVRLIHKCVIFFRNWVVDLQTVSMATGDENLAQQQFFKLIYLIHININIFWKFGLEILINVEMVLKTVFFIVLFRSN